jgi:secretion/DNA translocation related TadE-like protein
MRRRDDRGAATLLVLAMAGVLLLVGAALGVVVAMVRAHRTAQSAADLAALAGAQAVQRGGDACVRAAEIARANGAHLSACSPRGSVVTVQVTVAGPHWLGQRADLSAQARAGPAVAVSRAWAAPTSGSGRSTAWPRAPAALAAVGSRGGA